MRMNKRFSRMFTRPLILERLDDRINPATIVVNSLLDSGTGSLREAISIANNESSNSGPDTIVFDSSIAGQTFDITSMGGTDYGPSAFQITSDITIQGSLSQAETLRIQSTFPMRFFYIESGGTLTLNRMQLTGGQAQGGAGGLGGGGGGAGMGGAIYNHQGNLNIINSTLYGNTAQGGNGGDGSLIASTGSTGGGGGMSGNGGAGGIGNAVGYGGGGGGFFGNGGSGQGSGSTGGGGGGTQSNGQSSGDGGAGGNLNGGNGINDISSSVPSDANGGDGGGGGGGTGRTSGGHGGIGGGGGGSGFNFEVSGQLGGSGGFGGGGAAGYAFGGRGGFGGGGGGTGNGGSEGGGFSGPFGGGGSTGMGFTTGALIAAGGGGAGLGGAIFNDDGIITIENSTFSGNSAIGGKGGTGNSGTPNGEDGSGAGGAIFAYGGSPGGTGTISILNSTLTESTADFGRQVYAYRPSASSPPALHFNNSIFAQSDMSIPDVEGTPSDAGGGFNNLVGSTNLVVDVLLNSVVALPNLGSLADNGGGILTHLPLFGSPAIDAGNNDNALTLTTDQRLYAPRIFGSAVDIGSVETSALPASPPLELTPPPEQTGTEGISGTYQLGSLSDAANTGNYSVTVQWGDGTSDTQFTQPTMGTLAAQGHTYASDGTYVVSVFAENSLQTSNTIQFNIVVANTPPMLTAPPDQNGTEGIAGTFNLGSLDDLYTSGDYTITVNWGDGSSDNIFTQSAVGVFPPLDHTYATDGSYIVSVSAVESDINQDNISNTIQFNIVVVNSPPRLVAPADQLSSEGSNTSFSLGTLSDPNNSGNYTIAVNWGDGRPNTVFTQATTGQLTTQSHTYIQNGTYDVTVTATDGDGTSNAITFTVLTANVLPAITPAATQSGLTHNPIDLNIGSFADPGILDSPWTVSIDFGDGSVPVVFDQPSPGAIPIQTHAFSSAGTYPVTVSVTDDGGTSQSTFNVIVSDKLGETFATGGPTTGESRTSNGTVRYDVVPFGPLYSDTVRVAEGDVTGDGVPDLITGTGPGSINCFFVFDGVTHEVLHGKVPFEESFTGGIFVAVGDLNGDDRDEIIATADFGGGTRLRVFDGITTDPIADFFGIDDSNFRGGAHAAVGDFNNDGIGDLIVTAGAGGGPRVAIYDGSSVMQNNPVKLVSDFFAFDPSFRGGTFVAAGDVNGDGFADAIFGAGIGGSPRVSVVNGMSLLSSGTQSLLANFFVGDSRDRNGVRVAAKQLDGDHRADIVTGSGNGSGSRVLAYLGSELVANGNSIPKTFLDFDAFNGVNSGVFVG